MLCFAACTEEATAASGVRILSQQHAEALFSSAVLPQLGINYEVGCQALRLPPHKPEQWLPALSPVGRCLGCQYRHAVMVGVQLSTLKLRRAALSTLPDEKTAPSEIVHPVTAVLLIEALRELLSSQSCAAV